MNAAPAGPPSGCHQPNSIPCRAGPAARRSAVTVSITEFRAGSARRNSPATLRNSSVSAVMNQLMGSCFHLRG